MSAGKEITGMELVPYVRRGIGPVQTPPAENEVSTSGSNDTHPVEEPIDEDLLNGRFQLQRGLIGEGTFGYVLKAIDITTSKPVAVKITNVKENMHYLVREIEIITKLNKADPTGDCHFIVKLIDTFKARVDHVMILEYMTINLSQLLKEWGEHIVCPLETKRGLPIAVTKRISRQIVLAVRFMTDNQIIHTDLKPNNIMLTYERLHVRVIDFGSARYFTDPAVDRPKQNVSFRAPEVLFELEITEKLDIWSVGCILAEMHVGKRLFGEAKDDETLLWGYLQKLGRLPDNILELFRPDEALYDILQHFPVIQTVNKMSDGRVVKAPREVISFLSKQRYKIDPDHMKRLKEIELERWLMELVAKMLTYCHNKRMSASKILTHPFFTLPE